MTFKLDCVNDLLRLLQRVTKRAWWTVCSKPCLLAKHLRRRVEEGRHVATKVGPILHPLVVV